jgi:hypothetical protein
LTTKFWGILPSKLGATIEIRENTTNPLIDDKETH